MRTLPMTAAAQLARAAELGHIVSVTRRGPWPEHGDMHPKIYVTCTCGFERTQRTERAAKGTVAWHIGKSIGLGDARDNINGGHGRQASAPDVAPERAQPPAGTDAARHGERAPR